MKKVICFGEILWDNLPNGRLAGGAPMNVAYHLRKAGVDSHLISKIGNDNAGKELIEFISSKGIPSQLVQVDPFQSTSEVIGTLHANNEMTYDIVYPTAWDFITWYDQFEKEIPTADVFIFGSLASRNDISKTTLLQLLAASKYAAFDVNLRAPHYSKEGIKELLEKSNLVKVNEHEISILGNWFTTYQTEAEQAKSLINQFNMDTVIVTKGDKGSSLYSPTTELHQDSHEITVVDTVGSGDSFLAGFIAKKLNGSSTEEAFEFANKLGAFIATKAGACPEYTASDLDEFLVATY
jgi:fructokinase